MKHRGTVVEGGDREYLLIEGGYNAESRAVTLLCRPGDDRFPQDESTSPVSWLDQGDWYPIARWSPKRLEFRDKAHEEGRELVDQVLERYEHTRPAPVAVAWAIRTDTGLQGSLVESVPMGVAASVFDDEEAANEAVDDGLVIPIHGLGQFLTHLVRLGYAGALWNQLQPVFFCVDEEGDLQFLRVGQGEGGETVAMELLDERDRFYDYEGEGDLGLLDNRDACDQRMVEELGKVPLVGWPEDGALWCLGPYEDEPAVILSEDDGLRHVLLFVTREWADDYVEEHKEHSGEELVPYEVAASGLVPLLARPELSECVVHVDPGRHRAASGVVWSDGARVVLDSFSGFWSLDDTGFTPIEDGDENDDEDSDGDGSDDGDDATD